MIQEHVVITGGGANALGVLRSLAGFKMTLFCDNTESPAWYSRYADKHLVRSTKIVEFIDELAAFGAKLPQTTNKPILLITEEKTVFHASLLREKLKPFFQLNLVEHHLLVALQSKEGFQQLSELHQCPVPKAVILRTNVPMSELEKLQFPCVFKPLEQNEAYSKRFKKAYKVNSPAEVETLYPEISTVVEEMIVQEWLEGPDSEIFFCLAYCNAQHEIVSSFTGRKIRSWPIQVGGTASCTSAPEAEAELTALTADFVRAIGYYGLIGMEYKFDINRKKFYMIEPTVGRTDYQHEIAYLSGRNYLKDMVFNLSGLQPAPKQQRQPIPVIWYDDIAEANALANGASNNLFTDREKISAIFRWYDPIPSLQQFWLRIKRKLR